MKLQTGYLYHISSDFLKLIDDPNLQINHMGNHSRPSYFVIKDNDILWFIPLSSKVDKYKKEYNKKIKKYGKCNTILIRNIALSGISICLIAASILYDGTILLLEIFKDGLFILEKVS